MRICAVAALLVIYGLISFQGISLSAEQYTALVEALPAINAHLESKGIATPELPTASDAAASTTSSKPKAEKEKKDKKANIEATSDEEEQDDED